MLQKVEWLSTPLHCRGGVVKIIGHVLTGMLQVQFPAAAEVFMLQYNHSAKL